MTQICLPLQNFPLSAKHMAHWMQAMTSHWRGCLLVTGGDLNPDKCSLTPIGFLWGWWWMVALLLWYCHVYMHS
jgi:hypothetical protein